jgi:hypothetical protein
MLKSILKKLASKEDSFLKKHQRTAIRVVGALALVAIITEVFSSKGILHPKKAAEYAKTSVKIVRMDERGGGTGVILESPNSGSIILTNQHVCQVIEEGGLVITESGHKYLIRDYKMSKLHDLCEVRVAVNLGVNTKVAEQPPQKYTQAAISGHPALLPHVVSHAYFSGTQIIQVVVDARECTKEEIEKDPLTCLFFGFMIMKTYEAQLVTGHIMGGSSGSAVFNEDGEIAGLVFAGNGNGLSYAWIVPQEYVLEFVKNESKEISWKAPAPKTKSTKAEPKSKSKPSTDQISI